MVCHCSSVAPGPFLAEARLCHQSLGSLLPRLSQDPEPCPPGPRLPIGLLPGRPLHPGTCPRALCAGLQEEEPWGGECL